MYCSCVALISFFKPLPHAAPLGKSFQCLAGHADFHIRARLAVVVEAEGGLARLCFHALMRAFGFEGDDLRGAQQVRDARGNVTDLRTRGLGMPFHQQRVGIVLPAFLDLEARAQFSRQAWIVRDAEQPIERYGVAFGDVEKSFHAR